MSLRQPNTSFGRLMLNSGDIEKITGYKPRSAQRILQKIRRFYQKPDGAIITVHEFCRFMRIREEDLMRYLT